MNNVIGVAASFGFIVLVLVLSIFMQRFGKEVSRKFVHIALCNIWFFYLALVDNVYAAIILPILFVIINSLSYKFNLIKSMEREEKDSLGTVYYAISILVISIFTYVINKPIVGLLGLLIMGYGDGFAAVVGQKVKSKKFKIGKSTKSIAGSITMFLISLVLSLLVFYFAGTEMFILKAIGISALATIIEIISIKGLDNLTVPILVTILTYFAM